MTIQEVLSHFEGVHKNNSSSYQCKCPVHGDKKASLTISEKDDKILMCCHASCETQDILNAVGLTFADLGSKKEAETWKEKLEKSKGKSIESVYNYTDENGKYIYSKVRFVDKDMLIGTVREDNFVYGRDGKKKTLYNLVNTLKAIRNGYSVYITEGEKDVETLKKLGLTACTAGGVNDWCKDFAPYFTGATVYILPDNDTPGLKLRDTIIKDLKCYAYCIKSIITSEQEKGDVSDYIVKEKHTKSDLLELVKSAECQFAPWVYQNDSGNVKINSDILCNTIQRTLQYMRVRRHDDNKEDFYIYENGVYSLRNKNEVKQCIKKHIPIGLATDKILSDTYNLLLCSNNNIYTDDKLNAQERYINFKNGMYDIKTKCLVPHSSETLSTIQLSCSYEAAAPKPRTFLKFLDDLCTDDDGVIDVEKQNVLQEWAGLLLSNIPVYRVKKSLILYSALGNTGKSQYLGILRDIIGADKVANIPIQKLSDRFSVGSIYGKRLIMVGDQESGDIENSSVFKQLTGGDAVSAEKKGKQPFSFVFNGGIVMACNGLPHFTDDKGGHVFDRLHIVPLTNSIPKEKQDCELLSKMLKERSGILLWALEGLDRLISNRYNFSPSKACDEQMTALRKESDILFYYIDTHYDVTNDKNDRVSRSEFNDDYQNWCQEMELTALKRNNIQERAIKNGLHIRKYHGCYVYIGLKKKFSGFIDVTDALPDWNAV